jgi:predicted amidohydrolase
MLKVAAVQMEPVLLEPKKNLQKILDNISHIAEKAVQLAVFPECALTGYSLSLKEAQSFSEPIPGPATDQIIKACQNADMLVALGMIEKDHEDRCFNSAVLLGPEGILGKYRKTHLPLLGVDRFLHPGEQITGPFNTPIGKMGLLICYDLRFPEPIRSLAIDGVQVVLLSTAWPHAAGFYPDFMAQSRAAENGIYLVAANRIGEERGTRYLGRSIIAGPDGEKLGEGPSDEEDLLIVEIDLARSDNKKRVFIPGEYEVDLFADRRPELYIAIIQGN